MQEFDIITYATISARGRFIEYTSINQADGALRKGSAEITVKADGVAVGRLLPGESLTLEKAATRWEISATNYARVRIGMGSADYIGPRAILTVATDNKTLRGLTFAGSTMRAAGTGYAYVGIKNGTTDKALVLTGFAIGTGPTSACDVEYSFGVPINHAAGAQPIFSKHPEASAPAGVSMFNGETAALAVDGMTEIQQSSIITNWLSTNVQRQTVLGSLEEPIVLPPGLSMIARCMTAARSIHTWTNFATLDYGPR